MPKYKKRVNMDEVALPKNWDDMTLPDHLKVTFDDQQFLVMEENLPGKKEKIIGFSF